MSEQGGAGQGRPLDSPCLPPAPPAPNLQASEQGAASSIQFSFHTSLPLENGSHHPGRPPSGSAPIHCPALHPLRTEGWGQQRFPRVEVPSVGLARPPSEPSPRCASPAGAHTLLPPHTQQGPALWASPGLGNATGH